ncbi:MAG: MBL fold metallo-hydrolase [Halieaceae bacterium]|jgi:glyoxylase-like metal-dependent hydrolase (beta-lactamase superfamily II)|nr:MBL fold metallo-hydrolase [Halieaceae bacterium]
MKRSLPLLGGLLLSASLAAHEVPPRAEVQSLEEVMTAFGWDADKVEIRTEVLEKGFYVLFGLGGNIAVSSGDDGVLIVDDQLPAVMSKLKRAMRKQGDRNIDFVINTHWHFDHADGNLVLGGEDNTWLVSHSNSRQMMQRDNVVDLVAAAALQKAYPPEALPDITFDETMQFHINGEQVDVMHFGPAHTTGDAVVFFHGRNAVHLGDIYNNAGYPFIDAGNGGSLEGVIATCKAVLEMTDADTVVIPGHGALASRSDLANYIHMLEVVQGELLAMIADGKSLAEIQAAGITSTWDERRGDPTMFLNRAYVSLTTRYWP